MESVILFLSVLAHQRQGVTLFVALQQSLELLKGYALCLVHSFKIWQAVVVAQTYQKIAQHLQIVFPARSLAI